VAAELVPFIYLLALLADGWFQHLSGRIVQRLWMDGSRRSVQDLFRQSERAENEEVEKYFPPKSQCFPLFSTIFENLSDLVGIDVESIRYIG